MVRTIAVMMISIFVALGAQGCGEKTAMEKATDALEEAAEDVEEAAEDTADAAEDFADDVEANFD